MTPNPKTRKVKVMMMSMMSTSCIYVASLVYKTYGGPAFTRNSGLDAIITFRAKAQLRSIYSSEKGLLLQTPPSV